MLSVTNICVLFSSTKHITTARLNQRKILTDEYGVCYLNK